MHLYKNVGCHTSTNTSNNFKEIGDLHKMFVIKKYLLTTRFRRRTAPQVAGNTKNNKHVKETKG